MRTREQRVWDSMKSHKPQNISLERIENLVGDGTPDVYFQAPLRHGWVELKAPKSTGVVGAFLCSDSKVRNSQETWHLAAAAWKTPTYVLARREIGGVKTLWLFPGERVLKLNELTAKEALEDRCWLMCRCDSWADVFGRLMEGRE